MKLILAEITECMLCANEERCCAKQLIMGMGWPIATMELAMMNCQSPQTPADTD